MARSRSWTPAELAVGEPGDADAGRVRDAAAKADASPPQGMVEIVYGLRVGPDEQRIVGIGGDTRRPAKLRGAAALGAHGGLPQGCSASAVERREQAGGEQRGLHEVLVLQQRFAIWPGQRHRRECSWLLACQGRSCRTAPPTNDIENCLRGDEGSLLV
ncbi:hypothetical protein [Streptomyces lydicus]|uniref:hypothetical protein n=1 Tax=Streptomyces lydicus TaxID=47763 RepID=UPI0013E996DF|nr:hypothetical protein [Streptomyces lydicus]MCZ1010828.1 hypothetical protein [Streptomyces lydicus]